MSRQVAVGKFLEQPVRFRHNAGRGPDMQFTAEGPGFGVEVTGDHVSTVLVHRAGPEGDTQGHRVDAAMRTEQMEMTLVGARPGVSGRLLNATGAKSSYFLGQDPAQWRIGVTEFERLRFDGVYPGIDVVYYGSGKSLEHDFVVGAGGHAESIRLRFNGLKPSVAENGDLILVGHGGDLRLLKPVAYQTVNEARSEVSLAYTVASDGEVGLRVGDYDRTRTLVIDPTLAYASYFGTYNTIINAMALDASGNIFLTGQTYAGFGIAAKGASLSSGGGTYDAFLAKLDPTGANVLFAAYVGGDKTDAATGVALDSAGNAYITGITNSTTFPTLNAYQGTFRVTSCYSSTIVCFNGFVTAVKADGSALIYSTYLGGTTHDEANAIAVDASQNAYVTGYTQSANFPTLNAYQAAFNNGTTCGTTGNCQEAFVTKLSSAGTLVFSTYLGKTGINSGNGIAVDSSSNIYVTGLANSDFPQANRLLFNGSTLTASSGTFVTEMAANGASLIYSDIVAFGIGNAIAVDPSGAAYVTGLMNGGTNLPVTTGAYSSTPANVFAFKVAAGGGSLAYSTYIGGTNNASMQNQATAIAVDSSGNAWLGGFTDSNAFPTVSALQTAGGGLFAVSSDGGATFSVANAGLFSSPPTAFLLDSSHAGLLLVGQYNSTVTVCQTASSAACGGLFTSANGGTTWSALAQTGLTDVRIITVVRPASSAATLYALTPSGMFRSQDDGATWALRAGTGLPALNGTSLTLATDAANANVVYFSQASVGTPKVWMTNDGGATWVSMSTGLPVSGNISFLLADTVTTGTVYAGIGNKVYKTVNAGVAWTLPNATGVGSSLTALSLDPQVPTTIYAGTQSGYKKSTDGGTTFTAGNSQFSVYSTGITVDPTNSLTLYARRMDAGYWAIYKSTDGGATFAVTPFTNSSPTSLTIDPASNSHLYVLTGAAATAFLTKVKPDGNGLLFSTYYGGVGHSRFEAVASDTGGHTFAAGFSDSSNLVTTNSGGRPSAVIGRPRLQPMEGNPGNGTTPTNENGTTVNPSPTGEGTDNGMYLQLYSPPSGADLSVTTHPINVYPSRLGDSGTVNAVVGNVAPQDGGFVPLTAQSPVLTITLPLGITPHRLPANCTGSTVITCNLDPLAPGKFAFANIYVDSSVSPTRALSYTAMVTSSTVDPDSSNNSSSNQINVVYPAADLGLIAGGSAQSSGGGVISMTAVNNGDHAANNVAITVSLGSGTFRFTSSQPSCEEGTTGYGTGTLVCVIGVFNTPGEIQVAFNITGTLTQSSTFAASIADRGDTVDPNGANSSVGGTVTLLSTAPQTSTVVTSSGQLVPVNTNATPHLVQPRVGSNASAGPATDIAGNLWFAGSSALTEYSSTGSLLSGPGFSGGGLATPTGIAIDGYGAVWLTNSNATISVFDNSGTPVTPATGYAGGQNAPSGIAVDSSGSVWVVNAGNNSVTRFFGAAAPVATPISTNVPNGTGARLP